MLLETKLEVTQNSCLNYCSELKDRSHIGKNEFEITNWLPVLNRVDQCLAVVAYSLKNVFSPKNVSDISSLRISTNIRTRSSTNSFFVRFYEKEIARKSIFNLGTKVWNDLNEDIKTSPSENSFKHVLKRCFFKS